MKIPCLTRALGQGSPPPPGREAPPGTCATLPWGQSVPLSPPGPEHIRALLGHGPSRGAVDARQVAAVLGQRVTTRGLAALWRSLWPTARWKAQLLPAVDDGVFLGLEAWARSGAALYRQGIFAWRWSDGALHFHVEPPLCAPEAQALHLAERAAVLVDATLRALCPHPLARCTQRWTPQRDDGAGSVAAAQHGELFADMFGMDRPLAEAPAQSARAAFTAAFGAWTRAEPHLTVDGLPATAAQREALIAQAAGCYEPRAFLQLGNGRAVVRSPDGPAEGRPAGEAFLRSPSLPAWCSLRFVNSPPQHADGKLGQVRAQSQGVCGLQRARAGPIVQAAMEGWGQQVWRSLQHPDPAVRAAGYRQVGAHAPPEARRLLKKRRPHAWLAACRGNVGKEQDPVALSALRDALAVLRAWP